MQTYYSGNISLNINGKTLIHESPLTINSKTKYVLLSINGAGKTTLINHLTSLFENSESKFTYLVVEQDIIVKKEQTIFEYILEADIEGFNAKNRVNELGEKDMNEEEMEEYNVKTEFLDSIGWPKFESEAKRILKGLEFNDIQKFTSDLSGGWIMRLALAKSFLRKPDLLILDEPSNHLDLNANVWLTNYLVEYPGSIILITHQIELACQVADITLYIGPMKTNNPVITTVKSDYYGLKKFMGEVMKKRNEDYKKSLNKSKDFRNSKPPKTKKQIEEYERSIYVERPEIPYDVNIDWESVVKNNRNVLSFRDVSFGYSNESSIFENMNFDVFGDSKIVILGKNGCGKTTLFKLISGNLQPDSENNGVIIRDERLRVGYYHQRILENLPLDLTPTQFLQSINSQLSTGDCKGILGRLSLKKNKVNDPTNTLIRNLSGGQKARVALARVQIGCPHLLLLDESSNHLDIESVEALIDGINAFKGAAVIISHDVHLIKSIENKRIFIVENKQITEWKLPFEDYCKKILDSI